MAEEFVLRPASFRDIENVFLLSNDTEVRKNSIHERKISWKEHVSWFNETLSNKKCMFFIAETEDEQCIGQIRFSIKGKECIVSISISEQFRGRHFGSKVLRKAMDSVSQQTYFAYIKESNIASQKMFERIGFQCVRYESINNTTYKVYQYEK